jgi:hypothetical protein
MAEQTTESGGLSRQRACETCKFIGQVANGLVCDNLWIAKSARPLERPKILHERLFGKCGPSGRFWEMGRPAPAQESATAAVPQEPGRIQDP